jgi:hypothetical protein
MYTKKTMSILNMFIYKSFYEKNNNNKSSIYHCCSNVWNNEDSNALLIKLRDILANVFHKCVDIGKIFKNENF